MRWRGTTEDRDEKVAQNARLHRPGQQRFHAEEGQERLGEARIEGPLEQAPLLLHEHSQELIALKTPTLNDHIGLLQDGTYGTMYFNDTLNDWSKFDINKRTKHDASISSGLAIMACNRQLYAPNPETIRQPLNIKISKYKNTGFNSTIIK